MDKFESGGDGMNKQLLTVFSVVVLLAIVIFACIHLIPSSPEGYVDLVEIVEISKYSDEELQRRMVGQYRVDINHTWGLPEAVKTQPDIDVYEFEDINYRLIIEYDSDGRVVGLERNELNK